jgi:class 3 adenylate cyclase
MSAIVTALFCDLRGFTGFTESADAEDVMALLRDYHAAIGEIIIKYNGTLERYAGDGVMVVFNDPVPVENPALQAVLMALELRDAIGALTATWSRLGHEIGFGIGIAHGFATLGTIGFEGRFDYAAIGTVSNVASRLCDEAIFQTALQLSPLAANTMHVIASADDRFFPLEFQKRIARSRLKTDVHVMRGGHFVALSNPEGLVEQFVGYEHECD